MTSVDRMIDALDKEEDKRLSLKKLAEELEVEVGKIEKWANFLKGYVLVEYPANVLSKPYITLTADLKRIKNIKVPQGEILTSYTVSADKVSAEVKIVKTVEDLVPLYRIDLPQVGLATELVLTKLSDELTRRVPITIDDISDQRRMASLRTVFEKQAGEIVQNEFESDIERHRELKNVLSTLLLHNCYGLGTLELLAHDDNLEEICVNNSHTPIGVYHIHHGWLRSDITIASEKEINNLSSQIARKAGTNITNLEPLMDAHLVSGDRANATLFPVSSFGNTITIRKFARIPWTLIRFLKPDAKTLSLDMAALLWLCMQYELNVLVTGGTASGKTSMLNAICALIPSNHRLVSIEETRELNLPNYLHWNWIPLSTRNPNQEGKGEITMLDLITNSLRMRPDRVIMGEVRRKEETEVLFEAMHTGHSVYSTVHADTSQHLVRRMTRPPFNLPIEDVESLDLVMVQFRDRRTGRRRTLEMAEIMQGSGEEKIELNYLFRWNPRSDEFEKINDSRRIFDKLSLYTGMSREEIREDLSEKKAILGWMLDNDIDSIDEVGQMVGEYYKDRFSMLEHIQKSKGHKSKPEDSGSDKPIKKSTAKVEKNKNKKRLKK